MNDGTRWITRIVALTALAASLSLGIAGEVGAENNSPQHRMTQDVEFCEEAGGTADYVQEAGYTMSRCDLGDGVGWICDHTGPTSECSNYDGDLRTSSVQVSGGTSTHVKSSKVVANQTKGVIDHDDNP